MTFRTDWKMHLFSHALPEGGGGEGERGVNDGLMTDLSGECNGLFSGGCAMKLFCVVNLMLCTMALKRGRIF